MSLIDELFEIEREAERKSPIHTLDARIKLILCLLGLGVTVLLPHGTAEPFAFLVIYILFWTLYIVSGSSLRYYLVRLLLIMPFGLFFIVLQPFYPNPYFEVYHVVATLPFEIKMYWESLIFSVLLLARFVISLSFIILLSATTTMQAILTGVAQLRVPRLFVMIMGLTIRYVYVFALAYQKIQNAFAARNFNGFDRRLSLRYRLYVIGSAIGYLFVQAIEQGERTYVSMYCRGYSPTSTAYHAKKPLQMAEWIFLLFGSGYLIVFPLLMYGIF